MDPRFPVSIVAIRHVRRLGATVMICILPIQVAFLFLSDRIVEGIAAGSVKG
jgi:ABC-type glycerol-3-phosphate transport system permease component